MSVDVSNLLDNILDLRYFHPDEAIEGKVAIPYVWDKGTSHLVLVQGENAGGKSFFRRLLRAVTYKGNKVEGIEPGPFPVEEVIHLSMEGRTDTGLGMLPIARAMVYGDEDHFATGVLTAHTIDGAITSATGRTHSVIVYWDEPDIGMSAAAAAGAGVKIREFVETLPAHVAAVFVTSHSPTLVNQLLKSRDKPHYLHLGSESAPATAADWVTKQSDPNIQPRDIEELSKSGHARFRLIQSILNDQKSKKKG